jgi:hypothetical protein
MTDIDFRSNIVNKSSSSSSYESKPVVVFILAILSLTNLYFISGQVNAIQLSDLQFLVSANLVHKDSCSPISILNVLKFSYFANTVSHMYIYSIHGVHHKYK